jgi:hypothetical protein
MCLQMSLSAMNYNCHAFSFVVMDSLTKTAEINIFKPKKNYQINI